MKLKEAKQLVKSLLEKVQVTVVYYIDDYISFDGLKSMITFIEDKEEDVLRSHSDVIPEVFIETRAFDTDIRHKIQDWWKGLSVAEQKNVISQCKPSKKNNHAENSAQQLLGDNCVLCSPEEWDEKYSSECIAKIKQRERVLLLFDYKLGENATVDGEGRNGLNIALRFAENEGVKENSYCGIFSQEIKMEGDKSEFQFRKDNKEQLSSWAFPMSKDRLPENGECEQFIEGLNNLFWVGYVDELSDIAKRLISNTSEKLENAFGEILPREFKQIVINSSSVEGSREIDTLLRLIHIIFNRELHTSLATFEGGLDSINKSVGAIKDIDSVLPKRLSTQYNAEVVRKFFQDESFVPGETVNRLLLPLQNGDVFRVNGTKFYVLLCQPCNISLRKGGKRGKNYDIGYLVPLVENTSEDDLSQELDKLKGKDDGGWDNAKGIFMTKLQEKMNKASQGYSYKLKCSIDGKLLSLALNDYTVVSLSLLDYSTFSEDGKVIINRDYSPQLHFNQKALCDNHTQYFKDQIDFDRLLDGLDEDVSVAIRPKIERWYYSLLAKLGIKVKFEDNLYIFPIERYGHIQEPLASDLLTQLSHYISRAGLPNEFDR